MPLEDLAIVANMPVNPADVEKCRDADVGKATARDDEDIIDASEAADIDKAAAAETMPPPKDKSDDPADDTAAGRVARRGQNPPAHEDCEEPGSADADHRS